VTCGEARDRLSARLDEALDLAGGAALDAHLAGCPECRAELARLEQTVGLLRAVTPARAPAGFVDRVLAAARPEPWPRRVLRRLWLPLPGTLAVQATAVVLVSVLAVVLFRATPDLQRAARAPEATDARPTRSPSSPPAAGAPAPPTAPAAPGEPTPGTTVSAASPPAAPVGPEPAPPAWRERSAPETSAQEAARPAAPRADTAAPTPSETRAAPPRQEAAVPAAPEEQQRLAAKAAESSERRAAGRGAAAPARPAAPGPGGSGARDAAASRMQESAPAAAPAALARLTVADTAPAEAALARLVAQAGGSVTRHTRDGDTVHLEVVVPRVALADLERGIAGLGRWTYERAPASAGDPVRLQIRLGP
jgi:hypothetical protein